LKERIAPRYVSVCGIKSDALFLSAENIVQPCCLIVNAERGGKSVCRIIEQLSPLADVIKTMSELAVKRQESIG